MKKEFDAVTEICDTTFSSKVELAAWRYQERKENMKEILIGIVVGIGLTACVYQEWFNPTMKAKQEQVLALKSQASDAMSQEAQLAQSVGELRDKLKDATSRADELNTTMTKVTNGYEAEIGELKHELQKSKDATKAAQSMADGFAKALRESQNKVGLAPEVKTQTLRDKYIAEINGQIAEVNEQIAALQLQAQQMQRQIAIRNRETYHSITSDLPAKLQDCNKQIADLQQQAIDLQDQLNKLK